MLSNANFFVSQHLLSIVWCADVLPIHQPTVAKGTMQPPLGCIRSLHSVLWEGLLASVVHDKLGHHAGA